MKYTTDELRSRVRARGMVRVALTPMEYEELEQQGFVVKMFQTQPDKRAPHYGKRVCEVRLK